MSSAAKRMYSVEDIEIACGNYGTGANHPDQILYESFVSANLLVCCLLVFCECQPAGGLFVGVLFIGVLFVSVLFVDVLLVGVFFVHYNVLVVC